MLTACLLLAQTVQSDPLGGGSGWIGAGLLGAVLAWLMWINIPAKDKLLMEVMGKYDQRLAAKDQIITEIMDKSDKRVTTVVTAYAEEREKDRMSRHQIANQFAIAVAEMHKLQRDEFRTMAREMKDVVTGCVRHCGATEEGLQGKVTKRS